MEYLNIFVTSDLHGYLPIVTSPFDLMLICGDICPAHDHYYSFQKKWFMNEFADWINNLPLPSEPTGEPFCKVVIIGGNHDFFLERINNSEIVEFNKKTFNRAIILKNTEYNYEYLDDTGINSLKIFGTPYCKIFGNWAFMVTDITLEMKYKKIPENCDILMTHDAPDINGLGMINSGWNRGTNAGNVILAEAIKEKKPKFVFCGHIHSGNHSFETVDNIMMANVSFIGEDYSPLIDNTEKGFLKIKLNKKTKKIC